MPARPFDGLRNRASHSTAEFRIKVDKKDELVSHVMILLDWIIKHMYS